MKTNVIMKIAVVFMAAFGAYAFSGSNANELKPFSIQESGDCTNIIAECSRNEQGPTCMILYNSRPTPVLELGCVEVVKHDNSNYVYWE